MTKSKTEQTGEQIQRRQAHKAQILMELGQVTWSRIQIAEEAARLESAHMDIIKDLKDLESDIDWIKNGEEY